MKQHLWQGEWIDDQELERRVAGLPQVIEVALRRGLDTYTLLSTLDTLSRRLGPAGDVYPRLRDAALEAGLPPKEVEAGISSIAFFISRRSIEEKLRRELSTTEPFTPMRIDYTRSLFESWTPLGFLVHIMPSNVFTVGALALVEGLLAGNINFVKTSASDSLLPQLFASALIESDLSGTVRNFIIVARISSKRGDLLKSVLVEADGVSAWGSEESISAVRAAAPPEARFIEWGHKISFAYIAKEKIAAEDVLGPLADEICYIEQQACSSPQVVYVETSDRAELLTFGRRLGAALAAASPGFPVKVPSLQEQAEITAATELVKLDVSLDNTDIIEPEDKTWRVFVEYKPGLRASPLYRSVWVKPLPRQDIVHVLRPLRRYLQTVGLASDLSGLAELSHTFTCAGVLRITQIGGMAGGGYMGEPHDGVYALQRFTRRTTYDPGAVGGSIANFGEISTDRPEPLIPKVPVLTKEGFQALSPEESSKQLFFTSGGSSGEPKVSIFTWDDYKFQMRVAADGLFAAGLDPSTDRCVNLFAAGHMYGGFLSFFSILEALKAPQIPAGMHTNFAEIADNILRNRASVLLGMPAFIVQLFEAQEEVLRKYRGIRKIFFGGEHLEPASRRHLSETFGVEVIRAAVYGSNDAGPLGFQCEYCDPAVYHLNARLQALEILRQDEDAPVSPGETGRLIFTSLHRSGQPLNRYEIEDLGRWVEGPCRCGRTIPRFELQGRFGDTFRLCSLYLNYNKFAHILGEHSGYSGNLQIEYGRKIDGKDSMVVMLDRTAGLDPEEVSKTIVDNYKEVRVWTVDNPAFVMQVRMISPEEFVTVPRTGKIRHLIEIKEDS
jgi:phenylacetate-coenzyme A ligase PaaK-like adenylate-forming protein